MTKSNTQQTTCLMGMMCLGDLELGIFATTDEPSTDVYLFGERLGTTW